MTYARREHTFTFLRITRVVRRASIFDMQFSPRTPHALDFSENFEYRLAGEKSEPERRFGIPRIFESTRASRIFGSHLASVCSLVFRSPPLRRFFSSAIPRPSTHSFSLSRTAGKFGSDRRLSRKLRRVSAGPLAIERNKEGGMKEKERGKKEESPRGGRGRADIPAD